MAKKKKTTKASKTTKSKKAATKKKVAKKATAKKATKKVAKKAVAKKTTTKKAAKTSTAKAKKATKKVAKKATKKIAKKAVAKKATKKVATKKTATKSKATKKSAAKKTDVVSKAKKAVKDVKETVEEVLIPAIDQVVEEVVEGVQSVVESNESDEVILTDAEGRRYCRVLDCDQVGLVEGYCRYHYLLYWKKIQVRKKILSEDKLQEYIEELTSRYPDKFLEVLKKDLISEKDFLATIRELELDDEATESVNDYDNDDDDRLNDEVRGMGVLPGSTRRDDDY